MADWFTSFTQQAFKLADEIVDSISAQATEAQAQLESEKKKLDTAENERAQLFKSHLLLPWETEEEPLQILCKAVMEQVLSLSNYEKNFTVKAANSEQVHFSFQHFVPVAMKLLQVDSNLARIHSKLSPKMNEEVFWFNYFCRVSYIRAVSGIDGSIAQKSVEMWKESDIIMNDVPSSPINAIPITQPTNFSAEYSEKSLKPTPSNNATTSSSSPPRTPQQSTSISIKEELDDLDIDLDNLELLDELGDIDPDDFENIGSEECDEALEAQIALELADIEDD